MLSSLLLSLYFTSLVLFSFVNHPITYCLLLLLSAISASSYVYILSGFSWYLVLFCLVYVGGVYILFIFVSVHSPNPNPSGGGSFSMFVLVFVFLSLIMQGFNINTPIFGESSHYLCSFFEGFTYCFFCLILMIGFVCVSIVVGEKDSFFR